MFSQKALDNVDLNRWVVDMSAVYYKMTETIPSTSAHLIDRSWVSLSYKTVDTVVLYY